MTTFYICRHGETEWNNSGRHQGWADTPLTPEGVKNAESASTKLKNKNLDKIISSDLGRAFRTSYIIANQIGFSKTIECKSGLREINYGDLAGDSYDSFPALSPEKISNYVYPNGESLELMKSRILNTVHNLAKENPGKTILLVGHDGTINSIHSEYNEIAIGEADKIHNPHDYVARFEIIDGKMINFREIK